MPELQLVAFKSNLIRVPSEGLIKQIGAWQTDLSEE